MQLIALDLLKLLIHTIQDEFRTAGLSPHLCKLRQNKLSFKKYNTLKFIETNTITCSLYKRKWEQQKMKRSQEMHSGNNKDMLQLSAREINLSNVTFSY